MVRDHHRNVNLQFTASLPPQQIKEAMVGLGHENRDAFSLCSAGQLPFRAVGSLNFRSYLFLQLGALGAEMLQVELGALEEYSAGRVGGMLVQGDDVRPEVRQDTADGADDSRAIGALYQETADRFLFQRKWRRTLIGPRADG